MSQRGGKKGRRLSKDCTRGRLSVLVPARTDRVPELLDRERESFIRQTYFSNTEPRLDVGWI